MRNEADERNACAEYIDEKKQDSLSSHEGMDGMDMGEMNMPALSVRWGNNDIPYRTCTIRQR